MKRPFFSIITCTHNSKKYIAKNIESADLQTFRNFEHIFIDGFSTDGTANVISKYKLNNTNNVRMFSTKAKGISNAMNVGIRKAKGKHILHLHSDDYFYDARVLNDVHSFLSKNPIVDWIYGKINVVEEKGSSLGTFPSRKIYRLLPRYFLKYFNFIPHQAAFIKKSVFLKHGYYDETISSAMDIDMWLRLKDKTKWKFIDRIISCYTIRKGAQSSGLIRKDANSKNVITVEKRYLNSLEFRVFELVNMFIDRYNKTRR